MVRARNPAKDARQLWAAKLKVPPLPSQYVERARLHARLDAAATKALTIVSAPAGTGKTITLSGWISAGHPPGPTIWLSLEGRDMAAGALWPLLVAGCRQHGVDVPDAPPIAARDTVFLASLASRFAGLRLPLVLVLDCDSGLPEEDARALDYVLRQAAQRLTLMVLSRVDPLLPLHQYRLAGELAEIRMADLAFSTEEAEELLASRQVRLDPSTLEVVMRRTQGWAAGIAMLAMELENRTDVEVAARDLIGDAATVADYLIAEVLDKQTPQVRSLLLDTSVVDVLVPGLVDVLAGRPGLRALAELEHGNAFLTRIPGPEACFKYHPLFRDLLRAVLSYESPGRALDLHRKAGRWLAEQGMLDTAIGHALEAQAWQEAATMVVDDLAIGQLVVERSKGSLRDVLSKLPSDVEGAQVALVRAACAMSPPLPDLSVAAEQLRVARENVLRLVGPGRAAANLALSVLTLVEAAGRLDDQEVLDAAHVLESQLAFADPDRLDGHPELLALLAATKGAALLRAGDLDAAKDAFTWGSTVGARMGCEAPLVDCLGQLGLIAAWRGQLREAADLATAARRSSSGRRPSGIPGASVADVVMAWLCTERYDLAGARRLLLSSSGPATAGGGPLATAMLALVRARICRAQGDTMRGIDLLQDARDELGTAGPGWLRTRLRLEEARLDIATGRPRHALEIADAIVPSGDPLAEVVGAQARLATGTDPVHDLTVPAGRATPLDVRVEVLLAECCRQLRRGDDAGAVASLAQALRLAGRERLRRPFRESPREIRRLLRRNSELTAHHHWLSAKTVASLPRQRATVARPGGPPTGLIIEPLTPKEQEVLGHLSELLTTEEIASAMYVSANTVRTHVRNILRKLAASRRNEAVRRARELHLLTGPPLLAGSPLPDDAALGGPARS